MLINGYLCDEYYINKNINLAVCVKFENVIIDSKFKECDLDSAIKNFTQHIDRFIEISVDSIEYRLNSILDEVDIDTNLFIENINNLYNFESYQELKIYIIDRMNIDLKQSLVWEKLIFSCIDIIEVSKLLKINLEKWRVSSYSPSKYKSKLKKLSSYFKNSISFLIEYAVTRMFDETIYIDKDLLEFTKDAIRNHMPKFNINQEQIDEELESLFTYNISNMEDYKDLNKLAKEYGFYKVRQRGSHGIFKKSDGSTIVIPQGRNIGKGLNFKIQKDIHNTQVMELV